MGVLLGAKSGSPSTLLAAFVLSVCFFSTEADYKGTNITVEPPMPMEGGSVRLTPVTLAITRVICRWFRKELRTNETILSAFFYPSFKVRKGPNFTGRETIRPDCSLEITPLNITDLGNYITLIEGPEEARIGSVELIVHYPPDDEPKLFDRGFNKMTIVGIVFGSLSAAVFLGMVLFSVYRESNPGTIMKTLPVGPMANDGSGMEGKT
ncbi:carcinoembryonic antigen-related cell adhesion molecule 16-like [Anolis sagrei]|uniref:carcinoembryonic antigen-related cell adhesion molecule 16-like n=1 Tax=Anolis sagrei TaxID=38937 RepID=UPI003522BC53